MAGLLVRMRRRWCSPSRGPAGRTFVDAGRIPTEDAVQRELRELGQGGTFEAGIVIAQHQPRARPASAGASGLHAGVAAHNHLLLGAGSSNNGGEGSTFLSCGGSPGGLGQKLRERL
jgi:hypothetical protein